jgi:hypothetical protein
VQFGSDGSVFESRRASRRTASMRSTCDPALWRMLTVLIFRRSTVAPRGRTRSKRLASVVRGPISPGWT